LRAVIPGRVVSVAVAQGDTVTAGQPLLVLEAMKMQNELRAPRDGSVSRVVATAGTTVELGDVLVVIE
jgi:biotin carboxyl carrier protein